MICVYINSEIKKHDTKAVTAAINEASIGSLYENCSLMRGIFLVHEPQPQKAILYLGKS